MKGIIGIISFLCGLAAGLLVGYAWGVALAPAEGSKTRSRLWDESRALQKQERQLANVVRSRVETAVEEGRRAAAEKRRELTSDVGLDQSLSGEPPAPMPF